MALGDALVQEEVEIFEKHFPSEGGISQIVEANDIIVGEIRTAAAADANFVVLTFDRFGNELSRKILVQHLS